MNKRQIKALIKRLRKDVGFIIDFGNSMNDTSWGYEEGVLITGNEARFISNILEEKLSSQETPGS